MGGEGLGVKYDGAGWMGLVGGDCSEVTTARQARIALQCHPLPTFNLPLSTHGDVPPSATQVPQMGHCGTRSRRPATRNVLHASNRCRNHCTLLHEPGSTNSPERDGFFLAGWRPGRLANGVADAAGDAGRVEADLGQLLLPCSVGDQAVGHPEPGQELRREMMAQCILQHGRSEAVLQRVILNGENRMPGGEDAGEHFAVERLAEAGVDDANRHALGVQFRCRRHRVLGQRAVDDQCGVGAGAKNPAATDVPLLVGLVAEGGFDDFVERLGRDVVARVADGRRRFERQGRPQTSVELRLVAGGHEHHARQRTEKRLIHEPVMHGSVVADESRAIHADADRLLVQDDFLPDLVVGALGEGRIDRREWTQAALGHAGGHAHEMALANAGVDVAVGEDFLELAQTGAIGHGGGHRHHPACRAWPGRSWRRQKPSSTTCRSLCSVPPGNPRPETTRGCETWSARWSRDDIPSPSRFSHAEGSDADNP